MSQQTIRILSRSTSESTAGGCHVRLAASNGAAYGLWGDWYCSQSWIRRSLGWKMASERALQLSSEPWQGSRPCVAVAHSSRTAKGCQWKGVWSSRYGMQLNTFSVLVQSLLCCVSLIERQRKSAVHTRGSRLAGRPAAVMVPALQAHQSGQHAARHQGRRWQLQLVSQQPHNLNGGAGRAGQPDGGAGRAGRPATTSARGVPGQAGVRERQVAAALLQPDAGGACVLGGARRQGEGPHHPRHDINGRCCPRGRCARGRRAGGRDGGAHGRARAHPLREWLPHGRGLQHAVRLHGRRQPPPPPPLCRRCWGRPTQRQLTPAAGPRPVEGGRLPHLLPQRRVGGRLRGLGARH